MEENMAMQPEVKRVQEFQEQVNTVATQYVEGAITAYEVACKVASLSSILYLETEPTDQLGNPLRPELTLEEEAGRIIDAAENNLEAAIQDAGLRREDPDKVHEFAVRLGMLRTEYGL
jgi:hypothetical protein